MDSSDLSSTTEATATSGFIPPTPPDVQVLIPQNYPGAFYYPPCKCDLVNQVIWWKLPYKLWHACNNFTCTLNNLTYPQKFDIPFKSMNFKPHNTCNRKCIRTESLSFTYFYLFVHKYRIYLNTMTHSFISFQIRYYNPKTRQFYYHNAHHPWLSTMSPIPPPPGGPINPSNKIVLAGEPETFSELSHPFYQMVRQV